MVKAMLATPQGQQSLLKSNSRDYNPIEIAIYHQNKEMVAEMLKNHEVVKSVFYKNDNGDRLLNIEIVATCLKEQWGLVSKTIEADNKAGEQIFKRILEQAPTSYHTSLARSSPTKWDPQSTIDSRARQILEDIFSKGKNKPMLAAER